MSGNKNNSFVPSDDDLEKMFELPDIDEQLVDLDDDYFAAKKEFDHYLAQRYNELEEQLSKKESEINGLIRDFRKDLAKEVKKMMN